MCLLLFYDSHWNVFQGHAPQQQFQQGLPPSYSHRHQQLQPNTNRAMPVNGNAHPGQKANSSNVAVSHPTQVSDPTPPHSDQPVFHSSVNVSFPKAPHSQFPPQYGHTNAHHPPTHSKLHASCNAQSTAPPASQQTNPRAQDHHHVQVPKCSAAQAFENPPDNQATLVNNQLTDNIDQDIAEVAGEVRDMSKPSRTMQHSLHRDQHFPHEQQPQGKPGFKIPLNPNLVCSKCGTMFRHGEIQKLRKHYDQCRGKP